MEDERSSQHRGRADRLGLALCRAGCADYDRPSLCALSQVATGVADLTIIPALLVGGVLLWRRQAWGYVLGAGLLFLMSMLFVGLLVFFILQPIVAGVPFPLNDFVAIAVMSLLCAC